MATPSSSTETTKHTPGRWKNDGRLGYAHWIRSATGAQIATVYGERVTPESEANAALIVAAPDLLDALKDLLAAVENDDLGDGQGVVRGTRSHRSSSVREALAWCDEQSVMVLNRPEAEAAAEADDVAREMGVRP